MCISVLPRSASLERVLHYHGQVDAGNGMASGAITNHWLLLEILFGGY